jgi:iron complex transport system substrate-binding protein
LKAREAWDNIDAVKNDLLFEIKSSEILQPGPAALSDGLRHMHLRIAEARKLYDAGV